MHGFSNVSNERLRQPFETGWKALSLNLGSAYSTVCPSSTKGDAATVARERPAGGSSLNYVLVTPSVA